MCWGSVEGVYSGTHTLGLNMEVDLQSFYVPASYIMYLSLFLSLPVSHRSSGHRREGVGKSQIIRPESLALYASLNTLWLQSKTQATALSDLLIYKTQETPNVAVGVLSKLLFSG